MPISDLLAIPAAALVASSAWRAGALARSGAIAATAVGATIVLAGAWSWGALLIAYFLSATALSHLPERSANTAGITGRSNRRDAVQVLANGGIPTALALAAAIDGGAVWASLFVAALAGAAADTWATELGSRYGGIPRSIRSGRPLPPGLSGGVTAVGIAASIGGALAIAVVGSALLHPPAGILLLMVAGIVTSLADSVAGATMQARYHCPTCLQATEQTVHRCGSPTRLTHGLRIVTNDVVNAGSVAVGVMLAAIAA